jgi:hypothetical protein
MRNISITYFVQSFDYPVGSGSAQNGIRICIKNIADPPQPCLYLVQDGQRLLLIDVPGLRLAVVHDEPLSHAQVEAEDRPPSLRMAVEQRVDGTAALVRHHPKTVPQGSSLRAEALIQTRFLDSGHG